MLRLPVKFGENLLQDIPRLIFHNNHCIMPDVVESNYIHARAPNQIWPNLLYLYHRDKERGTVRWGGGRGRAGVLIHSLQMSQKGLQTYDDVFRPEEATKVRRLR